MSISLTLEEIQFIQELRKNGLSNQEIAFFLVKNRDGQLVERIMKFLDKYKKHGEVAE